MSKVQFFLSFITWKFVNRVENWLEIVTKRAYVYSIFSFIRETRVSHVPSWHLMIRAHAACSLETVQDFLYKFGIILMKYFKNFDFKVQVNLCQKLFFLQNMGRTSCVQKLFWMSETISVHNLFSPGLSLEFSSIELVIKCTICCHIVG